MILFSSNTYAGTVLSSKDDLTADEIKKQKNLCATEQKYSNVWYSNKCDTINYHNISKDINHSIFTKRGLKKKNLESYSYIFSSSEHEVDGEKKIGYFIGFTKLKKNKNSVGKIFFISDQSSKPDYECSFKSYYDKESKSFINETGDVSIKCPDSKYKGLYVKQGSRSGTARLRLINKNSKSKNFKNEISIVFFPEFSKLNMLKDKFLISIQNKDLKKKQMLAQKKAEEEKKKKLLLAQKKAEEEKKKKDEFIKVEIKKQEEFKPVKKNIDKDAPIIKIAENITVNDSSYEFEGKVTDQSKNIFVEVDGQLVDVKSGVFKVVGYSPVNKNIKIEAIDGFGNRSKPKIVKLTIDIKETEIVKKLEPLNPSNLNTKKFNNRVALIFGIENYSDSPKAQFANLDARYFYDYARKAFGINKQNIKILVDQDATFIETNKVITKWLRSKIVEGESELIIFFAGHGLASPNGKELYLLSHDSDPDLLDITALSRTKLFKSIMSFNPSSVTIFLDTCYSGVSRDEEMLLASARPIRIVADEQDGTPNNFSIFSASKLDQISSGLSQAKHGIFSYYLMKGLEGKADLNNDKQITNRELLAYMDKNVSKKAAEQGRDQNPSFTGDPDKVLMSYR